MSYFRPVQADGRPTSFEIASGAASFERGCLGFLESDGTVSAAENNNTVIGLIDDNFNSNVSTKVVNEVVTGSGTSTSASALSVVLTVANKPVQTEGYGTSDDLYVTGTPMTLQTSSDGTTWTTVAVGKATVYLTDPTNGQYTVAIDATAGLSASTAYSVKLTLSYTYTNTNTLGYQTAIDIAQNDTTSASGKATLYFLPGIYETDQFDPYVTYTPGADLYAKDSATNGLITVDSTSGQKIGVVIKAPSAALDADSLTVSGHENPVPNSLRLKLSI